MTGPDARKTARVRIRVAVCRDGHWAAYGAADMPTEDAESVLWDMTSDHPDPVMFRWVEADVPLPEEDFTIQGACDA